MLVVFSIVLKIIKAQNSCGSMRGNEFYPHKHIFLIFIPVTGRVIISDNKNSLPVFAIFYSRVKYVHASRESSPETL